MIDKIKTYMKYLSIILLSKLLFHKLQNVNCHDSIYLRPWRLLAFTDVLGESSAFFQMLEYWWMANNETGRNGSDDVAIEEVLQNPGLVILFVGYPRWLLYFAATCCIIFMLIGIPGNLITVIALFRTKKVCNYSYSILTPCDNN